MFERYTEAARRTIFFARYEASQFGSTTIETEHLLLGLIREDKNLIKRFLRNHSSIERIRKDIERRITIREKVPTSIDLPVSNEFTRILAYAAEEATRLNHSRIGTEHLLLGVLLEEKCVAAEILHERGVRPDAVREQLTGTAMSHAVSSAADEGACTYAEGKQQLLTDAQTGLYNKRFLLDVLKGELALPERDQHSLTLLILDVDYMKLVNDSFGHVAGDEVLKLVATVLRSSITREDFAFRFGGDEFAVLLPDHDLKAGLDIAEHIRSRCEADLGQAMTTPVTVTVTIGVCQYESGFGVSTFIDLANQALYVAKTCGPNTIKFHPRKGRASNGL